MFSTARSDAYNRSLGDESNFESEQAAFHNKSDFLITPGFHILKWTYKKLNRLPQTELFEAEIEYILVKGKH